MKYLLLIFLSSCIFSKEKQKINILVFDFNFCGKLLQKKWPEKIITKDTNECDKDLSPKQHHGYFVVDTILSNINAENNKEIVIHTINILDAQGKIDIDQIIQVLDLKAIHVFPLGLWKLSSIQTKQLKQWSQSKIILTAAALKNLKDSSLALPWPQNQKESKVFAHYWPHKIINGQRIGIWDTGLVNTPLIDYYVPLPNEEQKFTGSSWAVSFATAKIVNQCKIGLKSIDECFVDLTKLVSLLKKKDRRKLALFQSL